MSLELVQVVSGYKSNKMNSLCDHLVSNEPDTTIFVNRDRGRPLHALVLQAPLTRRVGHNPPSRPLGAVGHTT